MSPNQNNKLKEVKQIFRWIDEEDKVHEYRFTDGVCDGFFTDGVETHQGQTFKGRPITDQWLANLPQAGFKEIHV